MALKICTWLWGDKYDVDYVNRLAEGVRRHLTIGHHFICFVDRPRRLPKEIIQIEIPYLHLTEIKGCFTRLCLFDPTFQSKIGMLQGDKIACIDLDVIITGNLDTIFSRKEPFVILQGANSDNPCPYNGSVWMLEKDYRPDVWEDFSIEAASQIPFYSFPDDQGWFAHKMPNAAGWKVGAESGIYALGKPGWLPNSMNDLPKGAKIVAFPGWRDPKKFMHLTWVKENW